jgi:two-component system chemotaxis response regulator CheY
MKTVLVVDDEVLFRVRAAAALSDAGFRIIEARDGFHAIAVLSRRWREIAAVVVDTEMPGVHGWEVIRFARARAPAVRILRLGREDDAAPAAEYRIFEALPTLEKPFTPEALLAAVHAALRARRQARRLTAPPA